MKQPEFSLPSPHLKAGLSVSKALVGGLPWANEPAGQPEKQRQAGRNTVPELLGPLALTGITGLTGLAAFPRLVDAESPAAASANKNSAKTDRFGERLATLVRDSPVWSISLSVHCLLLIVLSLWIVRAEPAKKLRLSLAFGPAAGLVRETGLDIGPPKEPVEQPDEKTTEIAEAELPAVLMPQAAPTVVAETTVGPAAEAEPMIAPAVGMLLTGRDAGRKRVLLGAAGGSDVTEAAVAMALDWLKRQQNEKDGLWSLRGPYDDGGSQENQLAATAMALLAFQGAGNTLTDGPHRAVVSRAWRSLLKKQQADGAFDVGQVPPQHALYSHAQATMALCELYGMTRDPKLAEPAARAVAYCVAAQGPNGGWRYEPGKPGDMSVTGWYMMALKTAEMAGMDVPAATFARIGEFLESVANEKGTRYGYLRHSPFKAASPMTAAVTAEGLLCRQYLGWPQKDPRLVQGFEILMSEKIFDFHGDSKDVYAWYYITQVAHHMEGEQWQRWNERLREVLPREQVATGREKGSWDPSLDQWGHIGGRLFVTSFCTYMLEVYYRHLPLYAAQQVEGL
jgi:hypothetical protein